jgi:hypothetical protein
MIDNNSPNFFQLTIVVHIDVIWPFQNKARGGGFRQVEATSFHDSQAKEMHERIQVSGQVCEIRWQLQQ